MGLTEEQISMLDQPIDPSRAKQDPKGNIFGTYLEGYDVIETANKIFNYDWSDRGTCTYIPEIDTFLATVEVTACGITHTDTTAIKVPGTYSGALETASKDAYTTALKRALRKFGDQFGNSLYDKESEIHDIAAKNAGITPKSTRSTSSKSSPKSTPKQTGEGFAPNLRNNVPLSDLPQPNNGDKYACDSCGKEIKGSAKFLASEIAYMSIAADGEILCWNCKQAKAKVAA